MTSALIELGVFYICNVSKWTLLVLSCPITFTLRTIIWIGSWLRNYCLYWVMQRNSSVFPHRLTSKPMIYAASLILICFPCKTSQNKNWPTWLFLQMLPAIPIASLRSGPWIMRGKNPWFWWIDIANVTMRKATRQWIQNCWIVQIGRCYLTSQTVSDGSAVETE